MTEDEAIRMAESHWWKGKTAKEISEFQLVEDKLCMPWARFHEAVEKWLGRPVWTHEFACPHELLAEGHGENKQRTMTDVIEKAQELMGDKPVIVIKVDDANGIGR